MREELENKTVSFLVSSATDLEDQPPGDIVLAYESALRITRYTPANMTPDNVYNWSWQHLEENNLISQK